MQRQTHVQRQTLKYSPLQIQMLNLLHLTTIELEQRVKEELEENPLLEEGAESSSEAESEDQENPGDTVGTGGEEAPPVQDYYDWDEFKDDDIPNYKTSVNNRSADDEIYVRPIEDTVSFRDELKAQIHFLNLNERQQLIADFILDSLDEDGFLRREAETIADDISFANSQLIDSKEVTEMLQVIQQLDPPGIASNGLQEFLLIQMDHLQNHDQRWELARKIVSSHFDELGNRNFEKIMRQTGATENELKESLSLITSLNPKPASGLRNDSITQNIKPDFLLTYLPNGEIEIQLAWGNSPALRLNSSLTQMVKGNKDRATNQFLKSKIASAKWFIDAIRQREDTMLNIMKAMAKLQYEYFQTGNIKKLKPMILKDVADIIGMDISTVSRVTTNKYVQTPFGIVLLKDLFTEGLVDESGTEISNRAIQEAIREIVESEDKRHPLNDQAITDLLVQRGYNVARRTVAKYREQLNLPTARLRVTI